MPFYINSETEEKSWKLEEEGAVPIPFSSYDDSFMEGYLKEVKGPPSTPVLKKKKSEGNSKKKKGKNRSENSRSDSSSTRRKKRREKRKKRTESKEEKRGDVVEEIQDFEQVTARGSQSGSLGSDRKREKEEGNEKKKEERKEKKEEDDKLKNMVKSKSTSSGLASISSNNRHTVKIEKRKKGLHEKSNTNEKGSRMSAFVGGPKSKEMQKRTVCSIQKSFVFYFFSADGGDYGED